jgi:hypothetical protein
MEFVVGPSLNSWYEVTRMTKQKGRNATLVPLGSTPAGNPRENMREKVTPAARAILSVLNMLLVRGPARNQGDSQAGFDGAQQALRRVELHPKFQCLPLRPAWINRFFRDSQGARTEFTH